MAILIMDACALIAYIKNEVGAATVEALLADATNQCVVHSINLCEVYYGILRAEDEPTAQAVLGQLNEIRIIQYHDMDTEFWQIAGRIKAEWHRISLADCFAVALALRLDGSVVTSDHGEFDPLATARVVKTIFIR